MNLNLYRTFIRVVETQNLSRTAEELGLSQPAVSKQIQTLEDLYGILLLERAGRKLKTTEAGDVLYQYAREIAKTIERTQKAMEDVAQNRKWQLKIGASTIPGEYILPDLIKQYKEDMPSIKISIEISDTEAIFNKVAERELDAGIVGGWINNRKVEGNKWWEDELVVITPQDHRLADATEINIEDLIAERWIIREKGSGTRKAMEELFAFHNIKKDELNIFMETGSTESVLASVESGMGISIVSRYAVKNNQMHRRLKIITLQNKLTKRFFYVIYPRQKSRRRSVNDFLSYLQSKKNLSLV